MAALTHFAKVDATQRTTTATTANEVTQYTVAWADLTGAGFSAGDDVMLIHQCSLGSSVDNLLIVYNIMAGTTFAGAAAINDGHVDQEAVATGATASHNVFWIERRTLVVNENFYFDLHMNSAATARADDFSFIVLRLNELTENVDFKYATVAHGVGDAPTTYGTTGASVTIPSASEDWLALAQVRWLDDSATADMFTALNVDGTDRMELRNEGENTSGDYLIGIIDALVQPANGATVQVRFRTDTANTHDAFSSKVFILRLGVFEDYDLARSTATVTHSILDTPNNFANFSLPLTTTGDVGFFAQSRHVYSEATKGAYGQVQISNVDVVSGYRRATAMGNGAVDQVSVTFALVSAQTAGTLGIDFDVAEDFDITPNYSATEHSAIVFSFEFAGVAATVTPAVIAVTVTVPTPTVLAAAVVTPAVVALAVTVPTPTIQSGAVVTPAVVAVTVTIPTPTVIGGVFGHTYLGTSTVGGSNHTMVETESYVKKLSLQAGWIVSHVEAFLRTTDNEFVTVHPVIYLDNAGDPGDMVVAPQFPGSGVEFDGSDRWWPMATGYAVPTTGDYWVGIHAFTAGSLQIVHDSGSDQEVTSGGSWVNEAAGSGGGLASGGRNYSIRASIIAPTTITKVGRLTTGASNLDLGAEVRLIPVTITAGKVLLSVEADIKVHTANVPSIRGMLYSDNAGVPGIVLHAGPWMSDSWLIANTYRRFSFPIGRWVESTADYWIGVQMGDAGDIHLAFDGTGGSGGNLASDTDGATWTPESDNYSISGTLAA